MFTDVISSKMLFVYLLCCKRYCVNSFAVLTKTARQTDRQTHQQLEPKTCTPNWSKSDNKLLFSTTRQLFVFTRQYSYLGTYNWEVCSAKPDCNVNAHLRSRCGSDHPEGCTVSLRGWRQIVRTAGNSCNIST